MNERAPSPLRGSHDELAPGQGPVANLAGELLDAVDSGSSAALLEVLSRIALIDARPPEPNQAAGAVEAAEWEKLELLRALAVQLRLDLHAMLIHIYQRIEASRGYLDVVRHLAGREAGSGKDLWNALPRVDTAATGSAPGHVRREIPVGREIGGDPGNGEY